MNHLPKDGIAAAEALLAAIRAAPESTQRRELRRLTKALARLDAPDMLPMMQPLLRDASAELSLAAYDWFARTRDARATAVLLRVLAEADSPTERGFAARSLGRRGDLSALPAERALVEWDDEARPRLRA